MVDSDETLNRQKLLITASYCASFIAMGISMSSLGLTLDGLAENTRSTLTAISILFTARSFGNLVGSVVIGRVYDRVEGNRVMAATILGLALLTALTPLATNLWLLTGILFLTGIVQGILNIGANLLLVWLHERNVGPFMSGLHFFFGFGTFIAPVIIAQLITTGNGMGFTYLLLAVLILPSLVVALFPSPTSPLKGRKSANEDFDGVLITLIALVFGCYSGASLAYGGWITTYVVETGLADPTLAAYLTSAFWGALTVGRLVAIPLAARFKPQTILRADFFGALLSLLVLLIWPRSLAAVVITSVGVGFALASIYPTTMSYAGDVMPINGRVTGLFSIGNSIGAMIVPWAIGPLFETLGPRSMPAILLLDMLLALVVLALLARRTARSPLPSQI